MHKRTVYKPQLQKLSKEEIAQKVKEWLSTHKVEKLPAQGDSRSHQVGVATRLYDGSYFSAPNNIIHRTVNFGGAW